MKCFQPFHVSAEQIKEKYFPSPLLCPPIIPHEASLSLEYGTEKYSHIQLTSVLFFFFSFTVSLLFILSHFPCQLLVHGLDWLFFALGMCENVMC